jgi:uncharacterized membrane protein YeaQ/YmgE (transglycosylase-associated protein family)
MKKVFGLIGMTVGGWLGWQIGAFVSFFTAFIVSIVGTGLGLFAAQQAARRLLP